MNASSENAFIRGLHKGPVLLPGMNSPDLRIFHYEQPFYNIVKQRRLQFCFGQRPDDMVAVPTINQRIFEKHQTHLKRLEAFPLKKAAYYQSLQESRGAKSVRALSEITGEDWSYIARLLKTLELPESIQNFLKDNKQPEIVKHFHLRRLLEIVRLSDETSQLARFREIFSELENQDRTRPTSLEEVHLHHLGQTVRLPIT